MVCGCGAVGGYVIEGLVRAGIGRMRVVDTDVFSESNMNRQVLATMDTIGRPKAQVACERARSINPSIEIECMESMVNADTVDAILSGSPDILVDAIDTIACKTSLLTKASEMGIRTFSSMGAAMHTDTLSLHATKLEDTRVCPVARQLRKKLKNVDTRNMVCVWSDEVPPTPTERDAHGKSILGSLPTVPAVFGMTLANLAILHVLKGPSMDYR